AANTDATPATHSFTVDTVPPAAPSLANPADNSYNNSGDVSISGSAEPSSTVELFDGATSKGTSAADGGGAWSKSLGAVADGSHSYTATATDAAGNTSVASSAHTVTVDTVLPDTTIDSGPSSPTNNSSPAFVFSSNETSTFECKLDGP